MLNRLQTPLRTRVGEQGMRIARAVGIGLLGWTALAGASTGAAVLAQAGDDHGAAARIFTERVERYERLRARLEEPLPPFDARRDPWSLLLTRRYLTSAIRSTRAHAQPGNVFGPPVDGFFREIIAHAVYETDIGGLVDLEEEELAEVVVNESVPDWALRDAPQPLVERLPAVPAGMSYRMAFGAFVLWDEHAEIVIDVLPDAFVTR